MSEYRLLIDITVYNYNLQRSLKGGGYIAQITVLQCLLMATGGA